MSTSKNNSKFNVLQLPDGAIPYPLTNDYMFHAVLQSSEEALKGLLAALLHIPVSEIISVKIENPIRLGEKIDEKDVILDLLITLNGNRTINLEMQVQRQNFWKNRSIYYLCRAFTGLVKGGQYDELHQALHVGILDFPLSESDKRFYSENLLTDKLTGEIYSGNFALSVLCLSNIENATEADRESNLYRWAKLFKATTWEEIKMIAEEDKGMEAAVITLRELSAEDEIRLQCEARERYEMDRVSYIGMGRREEQINTERERVRAEKEKARATKEQARAEREQARAEKEQARAEKEQARAEKEQARAEKEQARADEAEAEVTHLKKLLQFEAGSK